MFRVKTYFPKYCAEHLLDMLKLKDVNKKGRYKNCITHYEVIGEWDALEGAKPIIGRANAHAKEIEVCVEFDCSILDLHRMLKYLKLIHPYEEPVIFIESTATIKELQQLLGLSLLLSIIKTIFCIKIFRNRR